VKNSPTLGTSNSFVASTLRKDFQILFEIYILNTPVGFTNVNCFELIKSKGNWPSPENQVTLGGYCGGASPPPKNGPIFSAKIRKHAKYDST
jgi:hypothetical protein